MEHNYSTFDMRVEIPGLNAGAHAVDCSAVDCSW